MWVEHLALRGLRVPAKPVESPTHPNGMAAASPLVSRVLPSLQRLEPRRRLGKLATVPLIMHDFADFIVRVSTRRKLHIARDLEQECTVDGTLGCDLKVTVRERNLATQHAKS